MTNGNDEHRLSPAELARLKFSVRATLEELERAWLDHWTGHTSKDSDTLESVARDAFRAGFCSGMSSARAMRAAQEMVADDTKRAATQPKEPA